eukprot:168994-Hanusia_phi.AAC.1
MKEAISTCNDGEKRLRGMLRGVLTRCSEIFCCAGADRAEMPTTAPAALYGWVMVSSKTRPTQWGVSH